jgi:hypothetical protein
MFRRLGSLVQLCNDLTGVNGITLAGTLWNVLYRCALPAYLYVLIWVDPLLSKLRTSDSYNLKDKLHKQTY